jgi:hypothetical protein
MVSAPTVSTGETWPEPGEGPAVSRRTVIQRAVDQNALRRHPDPVPGDAPRTKAARPSKLFLNF